MKKDLQKYTGVLTDEQITKLENYAEAQALHLRLVSALTQEYEEAARELDTDRDNQFRRRTLARTLFAMVEGVIFALKLLILEKYKLGQCSLSPAEYALLTEESYDLKENGETRITQKFLKLEANIRFVLAVDAEKLGGFHYKLDTSVIEWEKFRQAINLRNRLMHPKSETDLTVTEAELID